MLWKRRRLLEAGLALPFLAGKAFAQVPDRNLLSVERKPAAGTAAGVSAMKAPRRALVIGNGAYGFGSLKNPPNDARALGEQLKRTGFDVHTAVDLPRKAMLEAISAYAESLTRDKAVGLFYFAGHGVQLNYLLPTDAVIESLADIQARCVDVNAVIEGIAKAANPMNVVILDACRENPFGKDVRPEQKGLSQVDAPIGTLLAYATSPGNLASDGDGANGLYTEQLLREMQVPEAKIEDVFKRVRLAVRLRSQGQQIPWESTSLEDDFWFIPPKDLRKASDREEERAYQQQAVLWEKVKTATEPAPLEDFLRRYPSGPFSEIAQAQLDRILKLRGENKIVAVTSAQNPYTLGSATANLNYKVGDRYTYNLLDAFSKVVDQTVSHAVTDISTSEVIYDNGKLTTDFLGNIIKHWDGRIFSSNQMYPAEFVVGKRWSTRFRIEHPTRGYFDQRTEFRITRKERITVPAGTFDAFRVDGNGFQVSPQGIIVTITRTAWFAPERVRRPVATHQINRLGTYVGRADREELVSFSEA